MKEIQLKFPIFLDKLDKLEVEKFVFVAANFKPLEAKSGVGYKE